MAARITGAITATYEDEAGINHIDGSNMPQRDQVVDILQHLLEILFPGYSGSHPVTRAGLTVTVPGGTPLRAVEVTMPGDFSSAAFFIAAAAVLPGSELRLPGTGINPTRTGLLQVLQKMGAAFHLDRSRPGAPPD